MNDSLTFRDALAVADGGGHALRGAWIASGSVVCAEIVASSGMGFVLIDAEHSPVGLSETTHLLQAVHGYGAVPLVRMPANDVVLIKQFLDAGARNLVIPMVNTADDAESAVAATRYPPHGVRGVGSALARSSLWNGVPNYLERAKDFVSLSVQIETAQAVSNAKEIIGVDGVDSVFIGPGDLAASMGYLGKQSQPEVVDAVLSVISLARAAGKFVGVNAFDPTMAAKYVDAGAQYVCVTADVTMLASGMRGAANP